MLITVVLVLNHVMFHCRCSCGRCQVMASLCCIEVGEVAAKAGTRCITRHKDFFGAILNPVVLQIAYSMRAMELNDRELTRQRNTLKSDFLIPDHIARYQKNDTV